MSLKTSLIEGVIAAGTALVGALTLGTSWLGTSVCIPLGWVVIGPVVLLFVPALAIVTAISRRLGVRIEVESTDTQ